MASRLRAAAGGAAPARCDVAVVGGGFTGLSAAYHLARRGARVALLEATTLGAGASGRTGGIVLEGTAAGPLDGVEQLPRRARRAWSSEADIDCDLRLPGCRELDHRAAPGPRATVLARRGDVALHRRRRAGRHDRSGCPRRRPGRPRPPRGRRSTSTPRARARTRPPAHGAHRTRRGPGRSRSSSRSTPTPTTLVDLPFAWSTALTLARVHGAARRRRPSLRSVWRTAGRSTRSTCPISGAGRCATAGSCSAPACVMAGDGAGDRRRCSTAPKAGRAWRAWTQRLPGFHPALAGVTLEERWGGPIAFPPGRTPILCPASRARHTSWSAADAPGTGSRSASASAS